MSFCVCFFRKDPIVSEGRYYSMLDKMFMNYLRLYYTCVSVWVKFSNRYYSVPMRGGFIFGVVDISMVVQISGVLVRLVRII